MLRFFAILSVLIAPVHVWADEIDGVTALDRLRETYETVQQFCGGISDRISKISGVAKVNSAIAIVGTVASGGALVFGVVKAQTDKRIEELQKQICANGGCDLDSVEKMSDEEFFENILHPFTLALEADQELKRLQQEQTTEVEKSKRQGNWRTGLMASGVTANVASAIIAGLNKNQSDLIQQVEACNTAVEKLRIARKTAMQNNVDLVEAPDISNILQKCGTLVVSDIEKIEKHMTVVMGTSIGGLVVGATGTGTSIAANTDPIRNDDSAQGKQREKNLNTVANVSAGLATAAGAVSTGFNISLVTLAERLIKSAEQCEEVLQ